jgi:high-affinity iron transporter
MLPSFLLALREGLEIALIVGIVFGVLHKFNRPDLLPSVRLGVIAAGLISLFIAVLLNAMGASLHGDAEVIFEGVMMLIAAGVLTWMIFWMQSRASHIKQLITEEVNVAARAGKASLFLVAFVAVLREGIELALLLTASVFSSSVIQTTAGAGIGILCAVLIGWSLFRATIKLNLNRFFQVTSILLIFFAAGLVAHGLHEFNEVGLIPAVVEHVWDINWFLDESSVHGEILKTLFGYSGNPSLTMVLGYLTYFSVLFLATRPLPIRVVAHDQARPERARQFPFPKL